jgi:hypothetical protein
MPSERGGRGDDQSKHAPLRIAWRCVALPPADASPPRMLVVCAAGAATPAPLAPMPRCYDPASSHAWRAIAVVCALCSLLYGLGAAQAPPIFGGNPFKFNF